MVRKILGCILGLSLFGCGSVYTDERVSQVPAPAYLALLDSLPEAQLLDIRTPMEYRRAHLPGATNINYLGLSFDQRIRKLDPTRPTFIYCHTAHRSPMVARHLLDAGFERIIDLEGGYRSYLQWKTRQPASDPPEEKPDDSHHPKQP